MGLIKIEKGEENDPYLSRYLYEGEKLLTHIDNIL